jgi:hypothetical protein
VELRWALPIAFGCATACSAALDLDGLDDGVCDDGDKACNEVCVSERSPSFGCATSSCVPCTLVNATSTCDSAGECAIASCIGDFEDCNTVAEDGCEVDILHDPLRCGDCDAAPCELANARESCSAGLCSVLTCDAGWDDCNELAADGCEADLAAADHCGDCETVCTGAQACEAGVCA